MPPDAPASRWLVEHVRVLADTNPELLTQTYPGLVTRLLEDLTDDDLARVVAATLDQETAGLVILDAARELPGLVSDGLVADVDAAEDEWETTSRPDGPAVARLAEAVA